MFNLNNFAWKRKSYLIFDSLFLSFHYSILPAIIIRMEFAQDMVTASDYIYTEKKNVFGTSEFVYSASRDSRTEPERIRAATIFECHLPTRIYLHFAHLHVDLFSKISKGRASYLPKKWKNKRVWNNRQKCES